MQGAGFVGSTSGVVVVVAGVVWVVVVAVVNLWSSSTVGAKVVPVGFGMRERAGVGAIESVPFVVWW